jgi:phosphoserine phosphatase
MKRVIVLVAPADGPELEAALVRLVHDAAEASGFTTGVPRWLAPRCAVELPVEKEDADGGLRLTISEVLAGHAVDHAVLPAEGRRKKLLVADMDSTIITVECIDELADMAGIKAEIAEVTERAMRGELDFEAALKARVARLKGLTDSDLERAYRERIRLMPGATTLTATMRANGAATALVSGGFTVFTDRVAQAAGFEQAFANRLEMADGALTGRVVPPILGAQAKLERLAALRSALGLAAAETLAMGDGDNDIPMIQEAGFGIAFHAKPKTAAAADAQIVHGDLTAALFYQGYRRDEFRDIPA